MAIDWAAIEREYRAGQLPVAEVARLYGVNPATIYRQAKRRGWTRDLAPAVRTRIETRLEAPLIEGESEETVEAAAMRAVNVIRSHRRDIARLRRIAEELARRIESALSVAADDDAPPVGGREGLDAALVRLAQVTARVILLERAAFGLDERAKPAAAGAGEETDDGRSDADKRRELAELVGVALGAGAPPRA